MKKDGEPALEPKLRFPEFREAGKWKNAPLGELLMSRPDYGVNAAAVQYSERLPKYLRITDISDDGRYLKDKMVSVDLEATEANYLDEGDIVLARTGASVGKSYRYRIADGRLVFAGFLIRIKPDKTKLVSSYLANFITTGQFWDWVAVNSARSGQPGINSTEYSSLNIPMPPDREGLAEQQKIADCLTSVDDLIAAEACKIDTLQTHKKELMRRLFPRAGEAQPGIRFPKFQESVDWVERQLGGVCHMQAGKFVPASEIFERNAEGLFPCYGGNGLRGYTTTFTHSGKYPLIGRQGALCGNIKLGLGNFHATEHAVVVTPNKEIAIDWLFYLLDFLNLNQYATGQAQPGLSVDVLEKVPISVPNQEAEQQRIADCLSSLDDLIFAQSQKLAAAKTHKNGLMQQLFPSTGKVEA